MTDYPDGFRIIDLSACTDITPYGADQAAVLNHLRRTAWPRFVADLARAYQRALATIHEAFEPMARAFRSIAATIHDLESE